MPTARTLALTLLAMLAFAANSLLCRLALKHGAIDPSSFTALRLLAGAIALTLIERSRGVSRRNGGDGFGGAALFVYAACFSWAYVSLSASTGALLLFGAVQVTMIGQGLRRGERLSRLQTTGFVAACAGLVALLLPGAQAPAGWSAVSMLCAGVAWGVYSLRGRGAVDPLAVTAGNFRRACLPALGLMLVAAVTGGLALDAVGLACAIASGALASGVGYAIWYAALPGLRATHAASVQLAVPPLTALGAVAWLGEPVTVTLVATSVVVLGGIALVLVSPRAKQTRKR
jgi:drug/metabolite transporter (DMT)-like permease